MSNGTLLLAVVVGASAVALWADARFPGALPRRTALVLVHLVLALVSLRAAPVLMTFVPGAEREAAPATFALLGVFFPALVYVFLSAVWAIRTAQRALLKA